MLISLGVFYRYILCNFSYHSENAFVIFVASDHKVQSLSFWVSQCSEWFLQFSKCLWLPKAVWCFETGVCNFVDIAASAYAN